MKKLLAIITLVVSCSFVNAQSANLQWVQSMGGAIDDYGRGVTVDSDGYVYSTGHFEDSADLDPGPDSLYFTSAGEDDFYVQKLDPDGNLVWAFAIGGATNERSTDIAVDKNGDVYVTGSFGWEDSIDFDPGPGVFNMITEIGTDVFVLKVDSDGNFIWAYSIGDDAAWNVGNAIAVDDSNDVYIGGYFWGEPDFDPGPDVLEIPSEGGEDIFIQKIDEDGNLLWVNTFGSLYTNEMGNGISIDTSNNVVFTGYFGNTIDFDPGAGVEELTSTGGREIFMIKLDPDNNLIWANSIGNTFHTESRDVYTDTSGYLYFTGHFVGTVDFDPSAEDINMTSSGGWDTFILKTDFDGNSIWARSFGGSDDDRGLSVACDGEGNVYSTGDFTLTVDFDPGPDVYSLTSAGASIWWPDAYVHAMDSSGNFLWVKNYGDTYEDVGQSIAVDYASNILVTGRFAYDVDFHLGPDTVYATPYGGGADIFVLKLGQCEVTDSVDTQVACSSYTWIDGNTYTSDNDSASFLLVEGSSTGCNSNVVLNLTILEPSFSSSSQTACESFTWVDGLTYYTSTDTPTHVYVGGAANGCDSVVSLNLTIPEPAVGTDVQSACYEYTWIDGETYSVSSDTNTYTFAAGAANGCDSIVTLDLTIIGPVEATDIQSACYEYTWIDGETYTESSDTNTYVIVGGSSDGCDSIVTLDLTILEGAHGTDYQVQCFSYEWVDGITYTEDNNTATYTYVGGAANGCDSVVTLDLTIYDFDSSVTVDDPTITANESDATYQWLDCNDDFAEIPSEMSQSFTPAENGSYAVEIVKYECIDTSECVEIVTLGNDIDSAIDHLIRIWPNPSFGQFFLDIGPVAPNTTMVIYDLQGSVVYESGPIVEQITNFSVDLSPSAYYVDIIKNGRIVRKQLILF